MVIRFLSYPFLPFQTFLWSFVFAKSLSEMFPRKWDKHLRPGFMRGFRSHGQILQRKRAFSYFFSRCYFLVCCRSWWHPMCSRWSFSDKPAEIPVWSSVIVFDVNSIRPDWRDCLRIVKRTSNICKMVHRANQGTPNSVVSGQNEGLSAVSGTQTQTF